MPSGLLADSRGPEILKIIFPEQIIIDSSKGDPLCTAKVISVKGDLKCLVDKAEGSLSVSHSEHLELYAGETFEVTLESGASNPPTTATSKPFFLETIMWDTEDKEFSRVRSSADLTDSLTVTPTYPNELNIVQITRSETQISKPTSLQIDFKPFNTVPYQGIIKVFIPTQEVIIKNLGSLAASSKVGALAKLVEIINTEKVTDGYLVTLREWCSVTSNKDCPAGSELSVTFSASDNSIVNPARTTPPLIPFMIEIKTSGGRHISDRSSKKV